MRTKNFFKGLAVAAVALVGAFATSCSEENLNVNATGTPVVLPDGKATAVITVVDLGDMGVGATVLATTTKDITNDNAPIQCPDFTGSDEYVIPAAQPVPSFTLSKGENLTIPFTFYVVKMTSAFANVEFDPYSPVEDGENPDAEPLGTNFWGDKAWSNYFAETEEFTGEEDDELMNESEFDRDVVFTFMYKEGRTVLEEVAKSRLATTSDEEVIDAYVKNMTEWADENEWEDIYEFTIPACSFAKVRVVNFYLKPTYEFTYGNATKQYTCKEYYGTGVAVAIEEIPNHDHDHSHDHGGNPNAGGGSNDAQ